MKQIKDLYDRGVNIMALFRESETSEVNSLNGILAAYDLQAGSYVRLLNDPGNATFHQVYTAAIATVLDRYSPQSVLEAGVGEATTLVNVVRQMTRPPLQALGFDISWSRLAVARDFCQQNGVEPQLFVGELGAIPIVDSSIDVVFTSHSIEPNRGRETQILKELFRITRNYLVLLEPSNELGSDATRNRIEQHKYCLDLGRHTRQLGFNLIEHRLFDHVRNPHNETALLVIAKKTGAAPQTDAEPRSEGYLACPSCRHSLTHHNGNYFCTECLVVYPVIAGIPCLVKSHGMIATRYLERA